MNQQYTGFRLGDRDCGVDILSASEIIRSTGTTSVSQEDGPCQASSTVAEPVNKDETVIYGPNPACPEFMSGEFKKVEKGLTDRPERR